MQGLATRLTMTVIMSGFKTTGVVCYCNCLWFMATFSSAWQSICYLFAM